VDVTLQIMFSNGSPVHLMLLALQYCARYYEIRLACLCD